jgi:hypothetical protein
VVKLYTRQVDEQSLLAQIKEAFENVAYPGDEHIVHCLYDKRWGGTLDGPCRECGEAIEYFKGKGQRAHVPEELSWVSFALASFTPEAFFYWLPAFLEVAIIDHANLVGDSLLFRFQSLESEQWQTERFKRLTDEQLKAVEDYFEFDNERQLRGAETIGFRVVDRDRFDPDIAAALDTLKKERESRQLIPPSA